MSPATPTAQATVDIGRVFVEGGFLGLVIYAVLLLVFLLLARDFLKDYALRSAAREQAAAMRDLAKSISHLESALMAQLSISMGAENYAKWQRARDTGRLPHIAPEVGQ